MVDFFCCDRCGLKGNLAAKRGRIIMQELSSDGTAHISLFNAKAEVCDRCFGELKHGMKDVVRRPELNEVVKILGEGESAGRMIR